MGRAGGGGSCIQHCALLNYARNIFLSQDIAVSIVKHNHKIVYNDTVRCYLSLCLYCPTYKLQ